MSKKSSALAAAGILAAAVVLSGFSIYKDSHQKNSTDGTITGIIEGQQNIAILRKGTEEQMVSIGSVWKGISVSKITASGVEIIEGGSSRWLRIE